MKAVISIRDSRPGVHLPITVKVSCETWGSLGMVVNETIWNRLFFGLIEQVKDNVK